MSNRASCLNEYVLRPTLSCKKNLSMTKNECSHCKPKSFWLTSTISSFFFSKLRMTHRHLWPRILLVVYRQASLCIRLARLLACNRYTLRLRLHWLTAWSRQTRWTTLSSRWWIALSNYSIWIWKCKNSLINSYRCNSSHFTWIRETPCFNSKWWCTKCKCSPISLFMSNKKEMKCKKPNKSKLK